MAEDKMAPKVLIISMVRHPAIPSRPLLLDLFSCTLPAAIRSTTYFDDPVVNCCDVKVSVTSVKSVDLTRLLARQLRVFHR